jgi:hypothetical protein
MKVKNRTLARLAVLCTLALAAASAIPARAQMGEVKEKPPMYTYVSFWQIPRAQWAEMAKSDEADVPALQKALSAGTLVGFGNDVNLVHQPDGDTHDEWWSSMSMAGLLSVLDQFYQSGSAASPVLQSATKHSDGIYVTRFYNWHSGSLKNGYTHGGMYKLKADAPDEAITMLSKSFLVPFLEKLLADGTISEYEIDTEAVHTMSPGMFWIFYVAPNADSIDKVNMGLTGMLKSDPLGGAAFNSVVDSTAHRDYLDRTNATYK